MKKRLIYRSEFFSVYRIKTSKSVELEMIVHDSVVNTKHLPKTLQFIENHCPTVLSTECFNESHLPFRIEIKETEIAHLLEHVLIDELCMLKIKKGAEKAIYSGSTSWNWISEQRGVFHITFDIPKEESLFFDAFRKAAEVIEELFQIHTTQRAASLLPAEFA